MIRVGSIVAMVVAGVMLSSQARGASITWSGTSDCRRELEVVEQIEAATGRRLLDVDDADFELSLATADAIRCERATGNAVGGKFHTQKGREYAQALQNWLGRNTNATASDRSAAQTILNDLQSALGGR
jgi:hypothetical protein